MLIIGETDGERAWLIGEERLADVGWVLAHLRDIGHGGAVLLNGDPLHAGFATLARALVGAGYTVEFANAPTASDTAAELAALRDEVARLRAAIERALDVDEPDNAVEALALRQIISRALRGEYGTTE